MTFLPPQRHGGIRSSRSNELRSNATASRRRVGQSRCGSALEALTNVLIGFALALLTQYFLFPLLGWQASLSEHTAIALVFALLSLARSFFLRRLFDWLCHQHPEEK